jgi:hypothetical protein
VRSLIICSLPHISLAKEDEVEGVCDTHGREECTGFWWESPKERDHSEDQGVDGIRMDLREICWECGVDTVGSG